MFKGFDVISQSCRGVTNTWPRRGPGWKRTPTYINLLDPILFFWSCDIIQLNLVPIHWIWPLGSISYIWVVFLCSPDSRYSSILQPITSICLRQHRWGGQWWGCLKRSYKFQSFPQVEGNIWWISDQIVSTWFILCLVTCFVHVATTTSDLDLTGRWWKPWLRTWRCIPPPLQCSMVGWWNWILNLPLGEPNLSDGQ